MAQSTVNPQRSDPYKNFKFRVKWHGRHVAGASRMTPPKLDAGAAGRQTITLERGVTHDREFEQWANKASQELRKDIVIETYDEAGRRVQACKVLGCRVSAYHALPDLDANATVVAIQSIKLENDGWEDEEDGAQTDRGRLGGMAQRLAPMASLDDLPLPESQLAVLRKLAAQLRQRHRVRPESRAAAAPSRGQGLAALFSGEGGTGKTLAAEALAREAGLDLYRVDLSAVVSRHIGETEKNLRRLFEAAEDSGAILIFDEADALFGKRSEVRDSHDRYANIEVGYLLQRIESYPGLTVLNAKQKSSLDSAFLRRLRYVVQFPSPEED
ncbi:AAA family ATPase [Achromobacter sp. NPDC058515]|uniref:AAA family ATPase n=1 Tax=Achromobacter sp. NPDC058515 TaxID=3346533 RepID=UPI003660DC51